MDKLTEALFIFCFFVIGINTFITNIETRNFRENNGDNIELLNKYIRSKSSLDSIQTVRIIEIHPKL